MNELWKDIPGCAGYQVSNRGRIRSLTRKVRTVHNATRTVRGQIIKPFKARGTGYMQIMISRRKMSVHRIVAKAWCEGYFLGACVDHINNKRDDNRPENLEWVTMSENARRGYQRGRERPFAGVYSGDHPTSKAVISTCMKTGQERFYAAARDAVREGFDSGSISRCCNGHNKHHKGYTWRFATVYERHGVRWTEPDRQEAA